ncbi:MAG: TIM barrel protein [Planctomycetota bacterium]|jgi:xylose isomerase|nr:TIM barrel protein [Planctomycetota bacterium]MDP6505682.1 TIM barrel protein [Planctomycetota bacterium]
MARKYHFSFGPWNISTGADPFGPPVRRDVALMKKFKMYRGLGFDYVQFHDDDTVPADTDWQATQRGVNKIKKLLDGEGLKAEFVAPRLWEHPKTIDGAYTSNSASDRKYALERSKRAIDIANLLGTKNIVLWLAREGTYIREAKDPVTGIGRIVDAINVMLEHDSGIKILGEMKPNEPMDQAYLPTPGHFTGLVYRTADPDRVGVLIESAHSILAGLAPSDDMAYVLWHKKLWGVHLNDQNGLKYDQDKAFGSVNLRRAFNQVYVLDKCGYLDQSDGVVGLDVKAMRTTKQKDQTAHLTNSLKMFKGLLKVVQSVDEKKVEAFRKTRDYEGLDLYIMQHLLGK